MKVGSYKNALFSRKIHNAMFGPRKTEDSKESKPMTISQQRYHRVGIYKNTPLADEYRNLMDKRARLNK